MLKPYNQNIDAEAELTGLLSQYIAMEIDLEILAMLTEEAATTGYWSAENNKVWNGSSFVQTSTTTGGFYNTQGGWFATLGTVLQSVSNKILQKTLRGQANFLVISPAVATIMQSIPGYASDAGAELDKVFNFGSQKIGTLNSRYKVYVNPYFSDNVILMGYIKYTHQMEKMMHDKLTQFTYVTRKKYGSHSFAAGYLSSMVDEMVREMRIRGSDEMKQMADYYERAITQAILHNITTENV